VTLRVRTAQAPELGAVLNLWKTADAEPTHTDDLDGLSRLVDHDPGALLVAEDDGAIVGSVIAGWDGWRGSIYRLAVDPSYRRRGLGRALVREAAERIEALGGRRLQAVVVAADDQAIGFWRSSGWEEQIERVRFVKG
jgi:ribosomal protein S18 acetylase RimI-like enzyme